MTSSRLSPAVRLAFAFVLPGAFIVAACRKAEPEEIVNGVQGATGGALVRNDGTGGSGGGETAAGGTDSGGSPEVVSDGSMVVTRDSGSSEPPPPDCIVPEIPTGGAFEGGSPRASRRLCRRAILPLHDGSKAASRCDERPCERHLRQEPDGDARRLEERHVALARSGTVPIRPRREGQ